MSKAAQLLMCAELSGVNDVPERLANSVLTMSAARFGDETMRLLLERFFSGGVDAVMCDDTLIPVARDVIHGLYFGSLPDSGSNEAAHAADYFEALVWRVIQAHPPGLSGGYFGHWRYPPEDIA